MHVLLVGLSGVGKTHLLDLLQYNGDTMKQPTQGYYQYNDKKRDILFTEYGATFVNSCIVHSDFTHICLMVDITDKTKKSLMQSKSLLFYVFHRFKCPVCIIYKGPLADYEKEFFNKTLQLSLLQQHVNVSYCHVDFDSKLWTEGFSRLIEWIQRVNGKTAMNQKTKPVNNVN